MPSTLGQLVKNRAFVLLLLLFGVGYWLNVQDGLLGTSAQTLGLLLGIAGAVVVLLLPQRALQGPVPGRIGPAALFWLVAAGSFVSIYRLERSAGNGFIPLLTDEQATAVQTAILRQGRFWMPRHELAASFAADHLIVEPVYAAKYSPGAAILFALFSYVHLPAWAISIGAVSLALALFQRIAARIFDHDGMGLFACVLLLALPSFRVVATWQLSQPIMLLLVMLTLWLLQRYQERPAPRSALLLGLCLGFAIITRPLDALCLGMVTIVSIIRMGGWKQISIALIAILPWVGLQLYGNKGITGAWTTLPWSHYARQCDPYDGVHLIGHQPATPATFLTPRAVLRARESQMFYEANSRLGYFGRIIRVMRLIGEDAWSHPLLSLLVPVGLFSIWRRGLVLLSWYCLYVLAYSFHTYYCTQYSLPVLPATVMLLLTGVNTLSGIFKNPQRIRYALYVLLVVTGMAGFWQGSQIRISAEGYVKIETELDKLPRSIVLFPNEEQDYPVYNRSVAWPDEARVIRAFDLPAENHTLFQYYAKRAPDRAVYRFHPASGLQYLGTVGELGSVAARSARSESAQ